MKHASTFLTMAMKTRPVCYLLSAMVALFLLSPTARATIASCDTLFRPQYEALKTDRHPWTAAEARHLLSIKGVQRVFPVQTGKFLVTVDAAVLGPEFQTKSRIPYGEGLHERGVFIGFITPEKDGLDVHTWKLAGPIPPVSAFAGFINGREIALAVQPFSIEYEISDGAHGSLKSDLYLPVRSEFIALNVRTGETRDLLNPQKWLQQTGHGSRGSYPSIQTATVIGDNVYLEHPRFREKIIRQPIHETATSQTTLTSQPIRELRTLYGRYDRSHSVSQINPVHDGRSQKIWALASKTGPSVSWSGSLSNDRFESQIIEIEPDWKPDHVTQAVLPELNSVRYLKSTPDRATVIALSIADSLFFQKIDVQKRSVIAELHLDLPARRTSVREMLTDGQFVFLRFENGESQAIELSSFISKVPSFPRAPRFPLEDVMWLPHPVMPGAFLVPTDSNQLDLIANIGGLVTTRLQLGDLNSGQSKLLSNPHGDASDAVLGPAHSPRNASLMAIQSNFLVRYDLNTHSLERLAHFPQTYGMGSIGMQVMGHKIWSFQSDRYYVVDTKRSWQDRFKGLIHATSFVPEANFESFKYPAEERFESALVLENGLRIFGTRSGRIYISNPAEKSIVRQDSLENLIPLQMVERGHEVVVLAGGKLSAGDYVMKDIYVLKTVPTSRGLRVISKVQVSDQTEYVNDHLNALLEDPTTGDLLVATGYRLRRVLGY